MNILNTQDTNFKDEFAKLLMRGKMDINSVEMRVKELLEDVKQQGVEALKEHIKRFDKWEAKSFEDFKISANELKEAYENLEPSLKEALNIAYKRIYAFHSKQKPKTWLDFEENGSILGQIIQPVQRAGLYIPGGKAAYPSSLLMNAIPALVAGVKEIVVCTPTPNNEPNHLLLAAMHLCQVKEVYKVGGASAIALLAYGVEDCKKVDVISGPGNIYVATAKKLVFGEVNIDMIAGPSEIGILAQNYTNAKYLAWDLLSQAEHDEMASSILITTNKDLAQVVKTQIYEILPTMQREKIARASIDERGAIIVAKDLEEAIFLMNEIAPEHLELLVENPLEVLPKIKNAGAIFIGENTPEPIGDYIAGPNHTLPTGGSAKFFSPLNVEHFMKKSSLISFSKQAILELGESCSVLAHSEGLEAHKNSVLTRLNKI
ncbi:histidinol dehydrogenase [Helicobacter valdiviensis]|uniref:Histidinol dehydrogenase n=1 Tax=Helicobacter valdiviensis TaxID=1458358 RepID=A0A2W6PPB1_9HELI|nr:histidinol dehydrogenase [Helicobacter valdiviensis]PZT48563.1 histidinol dehydrogenase [Helicobacter valdiviensis]